DENGFPQGSQPDVWWRQSHSREIRAIPDDVDPAGVDLSALDVDVPIRLVGRDDEVGEPQTEVLEEPQRAINRPRRVARLVVARKIELGREVMMVEHDLPSEQLVDRGHKEQRVRRVVEVKNVDL